MKNREIIFDPLIDEVQKVNDKLNKLSNEKLKTLNITDWVELVTWINYLIQGKRLCN